MSIVKDIITSSQEGKGKSSIFDLLFAWLERIKFKSEVTSLDISRTLEYIRALINGVKTNNTKKVATNCLTVWYADLLDTKAQNELKLNFPFESLEVESFEHKLDLLLGCLLHSNAEFTISRLETRAIRPEVELLKYKFGIGSSFSHLEITFPEESDDVSLTYDYEPMVPHTQTENTGVIREPEAQPASSPQPLSGFRVRFIFHNPCVKASSATFLLWAFSQTLELVDGVRVDIIDCGTGSIWTDLQVHVETIEKKREVGMALKETFDAITNDATISETIVSKTEADKEATASTEATIDSQLTTIAAEENKPVRESNAAEIKRSLELEKLRIGNTREHLENMLLAMRVIKERAYMLKEGIGLNDPLEIQIDDELALVVKDGKVTRGEALNHLLEANPEPEKKGRKKRTRKKKK